MQLQTSSHALETSDSEDRNTAMAKDKSKNPLVWAGMALISVGLVGGAGVGLSSMATRLGTVGDKELSIMEYQGALMQSMQRFGQSFGQQLSFAQFEQFGGPEGVLEQLIRDRALENEAGLIGLSVGDAAVAKQILQYPAFQGFSGAFDIDAYKAALRNAGMTERSFEASQRDLIAASLITNAVAGGITAPSLYAETIARYRAERRTVSWVAITAAQLSAPVEPVTEAEMTAYFEANSAAFATPETRRISYAALTPEMVAETLEIPEAELQALYDQRRDQFVQPERRMVDRLIFNSVAEAEAAKARVDAGEITFAELVAQMGFQLQDVDQGDLTREALGSAADAVFALDMGGVSAPQESPFGAALYRVNAVLEADETTFDDVRDMLRTELAASRAARVIAEEKIKLTDLVAGGASIEDIVALSQLQKGELNWTEGNSEGLAAYEQVRAAAAAGQVGAFPELSTLPDGGIFLLRVDEIIPMQVPALEDVAAAARVMAQLDKEQKAVAAEAARLAAEISSGKTFADLNLTARTEAPVARSQVLTGTPAGTVEAVFGLGRGTATTLQDNGQTLLVRLDEVVPADESDPTYIAERDALSAALANSLSGDILSTYTQAVRNATSVTIDQNALTSVHSSLN